MENYFDQNESYNERNYVTTKVVKKEEVFFEMVDLALTIMRIVKI